MAFRSKRRRQRVVWVQGPDAEDNLIDISSHFYPGADATLQAFPLIEGLQPGTDTNVSSWLGAAIGTGTPGFALLNTPSLAVKRIVGSVFASAAQNEGLARLCELAFCIFKERVAEDGTLLNLNAWNPFTGDADRKRWMFRRHWVLQNSLASGASALGTTDFPHSNAEYGDIRSGCFIDSKMKTTVSFEENLFGMFALRRLDGVGGADARVLGQFKFRTLVQLRANTGSK